MAACRPGEPSSARVESEGENGPFKKFGYEDLVARDKVNPDITWMKDPALDDADSGLPPEVIAEENVRDLQSALNEFTAIARSLGGEVDVPEAEAE
ncbi:methyltransferase [Streptomyces sp. KMM 9044]|uniref:methyltransferase n=1 Tax=Streptomyces sp. KMM 9044 TaxID=2744474 RepID=UPI002151F210|nr:methyltransferase [Streptomyces sp. KMM 9044]WAX78124.1 methyltransferase [Streptomyces sp. KMM 9044]